MDLRRGALGPAHAEYGSTRQKRVILDEDEDTVLTARAVREAYVAYY